MKHLCKLDTREIEPGDVDYTKMTRSHQSLTSHTPWSYVRKLVEEEQSEQNKKKKTSSISYLSIVNKNVYFIWNIFLWSNIFCHSPRTEPAACSYKGLYFILTEASSVLFFSGYCYCNVVSDVWCSMHSRGEKQKNKHSAVWKGCLWHRRHR